MAILVIAADNLLPPILVIEISLNRLFYSVLKLCLRQPSELILNLCQVDFVSQIMSVPFDEVCNQALEFADLRANKINDVDLQKPVIPASVKIGCKLIVQFFYAFIKIIISIQNSNSFQQTPK